MEIFYVFLSSLFSVATMFFLTKLMGARQISQMGPFDYIVGITVGSVAADLAGDPGRWYISFTAMCVIWLTSYFISIITDKYVRLRPFLSSRSQLLFKNGKFYRENMKKAHIDLHELGALVRIEGYSTYSDVYSVRLEYNGRISIIPLAESDTVRQSDSVTPPVQEEGEYYVICDGEILDTALKAAGYERGWLGEEMKKHKVKERDVFLATLTKDGKICFYPNADK